MTRKRTSVIGVDFGTCSLRAVQLQNSGAGWRVHHWINIETEPISPQPPGLNYRSEIQLAFGPGTFSGFDTALVLSPPCVEYKLLNLPPAILDKTPRELRDALQFELDPQMPWPVSESEVAVWPIKSKATGNKASTMVVAARSASVQEMLDILDSVQLKCARADIVPNTMITLCGPPQPEAEAADSQILLWGVLDIGFQSSRLYWIHDSRPVFARILRGGGKELTETLADALHVDFRIAEQYKRIYGIQKTDRGFRSVIGGLGRISEDALPGVLYAILRPTFEGMANDIERSCRFALGQLPGAAVGPIYVIGGGARLRGLTDVLSSRLGVTVTPPDPKVALETHKSHYGDNEHPACSPANYPALAACIGLALMEETR